MWVVDPVPPEPVQVGVLVDRMAGLATKYWPWIAFTLMVATPLTVSALGRSHKPPTPSRLGQPLSTWQLY